MTSYEALSSADESEFQTLEPKILYFGTPVALISSVNPDGTPNLAPMSSFWALGWTMLLGISLESQTIENLRQRADCVVNLPSPIYGGMWKGLHRSPDAILYPATRIAAFVLNVTSSARRV